MALAGSTKVLIPINTNYTDVTRAKYRYLAGVKFRYYQCCIRIDAIIKPDGRNDDRTDAEMDVVTCQCHSTNNKYSKYQVDSVSGNDFKRNPPLKVTAENLG